MKTKMIRRNGKLSLIDSTTEGGNPRLNSSVRPNKARDDDSESNTHEGDLFNDMSDDDEGGTRVGDIYIPPPVAPYCSTESKGSRLIIKKIEVNNFKSFAGKVILGPFHHCFTAVIGPNGSGKSNVIDSMLFVFGYRANKIRCKKISALLHTSSIFPNVSSCSVAVHFCQIIDVKDNCCEEIPNSDIVVERTAFRDNSSFYTINGKRVQFKEVAALLKKHCVDLDHNRFLILQGEVETIAEMKPRGQTETECGMLEYLEDIVGTTRYKKPLVMINDRVETLTEERTEKHNRCKLAEREMNDLEQPYNEAVEYLRQENENTRTKNLRIQKYLSEKNKKLEQYVEEHETINEELDKHDKESTELQKEREEKEDIIRKEIKHFENLRLKKEDIENKLEKANKGYVEVQQIMTKLNDSRKQNKTQLEKNEKDVEDLKNVPNRNKNEIEECEKKLEQLFKQKTKEEEELQRNYKELEKQTRPLIEQREKFETELIDLNGPVDEAKADLALSETELRILKEGETTETRKYETMKSSYEESQQTLKGKKSQLQKLQDSLPEIEAQIVEKTKVLQQLQVDENNLKTQLMIVKGEINEKISTMQTKRSNNKVLDLLMRQKNEGKIPGILGRLGDLGAIDDIYNVAISTACGRLDNIVVDTVNAAQECIEYLKRYDVGRASFIALEKVDHLKNQSGRFQVPENAARLYDLVRVEDERVLPAFYFALRNTLVAKDLETGTRIAYGARRHRVVTLNGDVIETSGTMSGGGRTQVRGKMGSKVQTKTTQSLNTSVAPQKALEELQIRAENIQSEINFKQEEQGHLERELQQMKSQALQTEMALQKLTITIKSYEDQLPRVFKQLEAQKKRKEQTTSDSEKVQITEMAIEKKKKTLMLAEEAANKVCKKIAQIKKQIGAFLEYTVKTVQAKLKNTENEIKNLNNNIYKLNAGISGSERNVAKMTAEMERLRAEILEAQDKLKKLNENREKHDNDIGEYTQQLNKIKEDIERAKSDSSDIHNDIQAIKKRENDLKLKRVEIEQKLQTVAAKMNEVKSQIPHWREQLKPLRLHDIPGEGKPKTPLKTYTVEELDAYSLQDIQYKESVQEELLKKKPNLSYIAEYIEKRDIYLQRVKVLEDVTCKRNEMRQLYDDVRKKRYNEFMQGFLTITRKLKEMYQMITQGGDAELELIDSMDPFTEGVSFSVRPPKKTWKNISNLSGGEKTLSSLALVFALHYYKPSPLYFMDEIDAALDFKNISIVAHYIKQRTKNAQFIVISLRSNMFELSDYLVGIYKVMESTDTCCIKNVKPRMPGNKTEIDLGTTALQSQPAHLLPITECKENEVAEQPLAENVLIPNVTTNASIAADKGIANDPVEGSTCNTICSLDNISETFNPQAESTVATPTLQGHIDQMSAKDGNANTLNNLFKKPLAPAKHS